MTFCNFSCLTLARKSGGVICKSRHKEFSRSCLTCQKQFTYTKHNKKQIYCNRSCAAIARRSGGLISEKVNSTTFKHYGFKRVFQDTQRLKKILMERYGVEHALRIPGVWQKSHETRKLNGSYNESKVERSFYDALVETGVTVEKQINVFDKPIDMKMNDIFIQIDGVYWHGLDRDINVIKDSIKLRDQVIYKKWLRDRKQNEQFKHAGLTLVRLTDKEVIKWLKEKKNLQQLVMEKLQKA